jgi:hypothetical protein
MTEGDSDIEHYKTCRRKVYLSSVILLTLGNLKRLSLLAVYSARSSVMLDSRKMTGKFENYLKGYFV